MVFTYDDPSHFSKPAVGQGELFPTGVERILLTKDMHGFVTISLPDDRSVSRRHVDGGSQTLAQYPVRCELDQWSFRLRLHPALRWKEAPTWRMTSTRPHTRSSFSTETPRLKSLTGGRAMT